MAEPSVAVVVPAYRASAYLDQALASVATQTRPPDQVVVVDDGSDDPTSAIAERWRSVLPLEIVRHDVNRGLAAARRTAIATAGTGLIALLDADDVWLPDHLDVMLAQHARHGGLVTANALRWVPGHAIATRGSSHRRPVPPPREQLRQLLIMNFVFIGTLFEKSVHDRLGGFRPFGGCEDWDLWLRMVRDGLPVSSPSVPSVLYRVRADSMTGDDQLVPGEVAVLEAFLAETVEPDLRAIASRSLRHRRGRLALRSAYEAARHGRSGQARLRAVGALAGPRGVQLRGGAMLVAPRRVVGRRDLLQLDPTSLVDR